MKTVLLQQWYEDTHSLEIYNELERRKRVKEIGSFSTCTDAQLQNSIRINTTHIKMNAMSTRATNKERTKRYTDDTQTFTQTKRVKSKHIKKATKTTTAAYEHKDNFKINHLEENMVNHKAAFSTTLAALQNIKNMSQDIPKVIPITNDASKTTSKSEFKVTKEDYDKVLQDLLRVRPSRTEQEKALAEQSLREKK
jgi:hypothetical protein